MTIKNISGFYRVFRVFLAVLEPFLLALKGFEQTYCVFGPIEPPNLDHWSTQRRRPVDPRRYGISP